MQAQAQQGGHSGGPQPGYFIPTMAPHAHQLQQRSYYQTNAGPQAGQGQPGGQVRGPRWPPQGGQMGQRPQSAQYNPNYRGGAPRVGQQQQSARNPTAGQGSRPGMGGPGGPQGVSRPPRGQQPGGPRQPSAGPPQQFKYQNNTRNIGQTSVPSFNPSSTGRPDQQLQAQQGIQVQGQEPLTASMLAEANPQEQKQMLGERLFPVIHAMHPDMAGKITGMLLEIDNSELLHMLEHGQSLKAKVDEAVAVLQAHHAKEIAASKKE